MRPGAAHSAISLGAPLNPLLDWRIWSGNWKYKRQLWRRGGGFDGDKHRVDRWRGRRGFAALRSIRERALMAYQSQHNWWLEGPKWARGMSGLGQATTTPTCLDPTATFSAFGGCSDGSTPSCPSGTNFNGIGCSSTNLQIGNPLAPVGSVSSIIPGVANTYVYIGAAVFGAILLMGAMKRWWRIAHSAGSQDSNRGPIHQTPAGAQPPAVWAIG
jgi:hypothetical protein